MKKFKAFEVETKSHNVYFQVENLTQRTTAVNRFRCTYKTQTLRLYSFQTKSKESASFQLTKQKKLFFESYTRKEQGITSVFYDLLLSISKRLLYV